MKFALDANGQFFLIFNLNYFIKTGLYPHFTKVSK